MTKLASYHIPGLYVEDHVTKVPLDWRGRSISTGERAGEPGSIAASPRSALPGTADRSRLPDNLAMSSIDLFYRVVCDPARKDDDMPLLLFLQGGPGNRSPRPLSAADDGWIAQAARHFRIVLPDQRGTGRSSRVDGALISRFDETTHAAAYLKRFLADSIIRDFEYLRRTQFDGRRWVTLGQSYGGFLTLTYLSLFPGAIQASFTTGGIPGIDAHADDVYTRTFPRVRAKTEAFYERYPQDKERVVHVVDQLVAGKAKLPNGDILTQRRFQTLGSDFGMKPSFERLHWLLDEAFDARGALSDGFLTNVFARLTTASNPLYWTLQEFIYANGECGPIRWAAQRERERRPEFDPSNRPLLFTGEMAFPFMFDEDATLRPFKPAVEMLMRDGAWGRIYDPARLADNEVPLQAAVYFDDMYVPADLSLDSLSRIGAAHAWVTNEFEHDGVHGDSVFDRLYAMALDRGDLDGVR